MLLYRASPAKPPWAMALVAGFGFVMLLAAFL